MSCIILPHEQGSSEWLQARLGIPTASEFHRIITPKTGKVAAGSLSYMAELIAEWATGESDWYEDHWMRRGKLLESTARAAYEFHTGHEVRQVGLILREDRLAGGSPDGLIGDDGGLEIKCFKPSTHVRLLMGELTDDTMSEVHKALVQCRGNMLISKRSWWDLWCYCPRLRPHHIHLEHDAFTDKISQALDLFIERLEELRESVVEG